MESSKPLATESFSYSWLVDRKQNSLDVLTDIIKPTLPEKPCEKDQNFNFDVSFTPFHAALVHADEIFSDGHIMPVYADRTKVEASRTSCSVPTSPCSSYSLRNSFDGSKKQCCLVEKWRRSSKKMLQKCFGLMRPLYQSIGCSRKSSRVDDLERKVCEVRSWSSSVQTSPRPSSAIDWPDFNKISHGKSLKKARSMGASPRVSPSRATSSWCGDESSINEAILYCKRSIEK